MIYPPYRWPLPSCVPWQLWTDIADKNISCFTSDIKEAINDEVWDASTIGLR